MSYAGCEHRLIMYNVESLSVHPRSLYHNLENPALNNIHTFTLKSWESVNTNQTQKGVLDNKVIKNHRSMGSWALTVYFPRS